MTGAAVKGALDVLLEHHTGPFCLSRITRQNETAALSEDEFTHFIPIKSHYLDGSVEEKRGNFIEEAPPFDLILLDPPWPNRSVKRKRDGYATASTIAATRSLLSQIPVASHLAADGLVAVWVTNKPSLVELLTASGTGQPMFDLDSTWRKPWERLLIARRIGSRAKVPQRVLLAVPDIHSRKPNLRPVFDDVLPQGFVGLEVFARNLTAGWWSWGNEALRFQERNQWVTSYEADTATHTPRAPHDK
ncbi:hypothetical protein HYQ45_009629 [Verticillium longisporum]|uniref:MT-A70 family protein n=1 Tax=Verticillium longisporum TaxID=100787 RepID=A0A8I3AMW2_VERLO|nr:hypothetical protein HYQ45_009629 [Verticillium longisporum]